MEFIYTLFGNPYNFKDLLIQFKYLEKLVTKIIRFFYVGSAYIICRELLHAKGNFSSFSETYL